MKTHYMIGLKAMPEKLILLEGIPGSGKSTFARFIAVQMERNGYRTKLYHETTGDHPLFLDNNDHDLDIGSWMNAYLENWQRMIDQLKEMDDSVVLESALFQYPILNLLHKDLERGKITGFIEQICRIAQQIQPVLFYFCQKDQEMAIRKMIDSRGGELYLKQKYEQFMNEPYYKNRGNTGPALHLAFLSEYGQLANMNFHLNKFNKLSVENSKGEWESYQKQLLQFLNLSFYDDPMIDANILKDYAGKYRNEKMNLNLTVEHVDGQLFIFGDRRLRPKNLYQFYLSDISVEVTFNRDENGLVNNLVVGEKDIHVNMKDEGTQFIKIS